MKKLSEVTWIVLFLIVAGAGIWIGLVKFEWEKPILRISPDTSFIGQQLSFIVEDRKSGVAELRVELSQGGKTETLLAETYPKGTPRVEKTLVMRPLPQGFKDGVAHIKVSVRDHSWIRGNPVILEKNVTLDTLPPLLTVLGALHYINQGGAGLVTYQTSEEAPVNGAQVGEFFFPGYSAGTNGYLAYFALPFDSPREVSAWVMAQDRAGNETKVSYRLVVKAKKFPKDQIQVTDALLNNLIPYFTSQNPNLQGTPLDIFLFLNRKQRELDHQEIKKLCQNTGANPLWSGSFLRFPNSKPMALYGQNRTYWYNGKEIDQQVHLGIDLASLAQSPIPAANTGRVIFTGPLGIYGNTVVIDHGCGLFSMYSHLSRIETEINKEVKRGETIGRTGSTGMAGGDHLHYAMLVNGLFVNPVEWWDEHWIKDNIELKMKSFSENSAK